MNLKGKKIQVTNVIIESEYYKNGDILKVSSNGKYSNLQQEGTVITECGNVLLSSEYVLLEDEAC